MMLTVKVSFSRILIDMEHDVPVKWQLKPTILIVWLGSRLMLELEVSVAISHCKYSWIVS